MHWITPNPRREALAHLHHPPLRNRVNRIDTSNTTMSRSLASLRAGLRASRVGVRTLRTASVLAQAQPSTPPFREPVGVNPADAYRPINSPIHDYGQYLTTCLPKYIQQFSVYKDELTLYIPPSAVVNVLTFLRDHSQCQYTQVSDITAADYPTRENRFEVSMKLAEGEVLGEVLGMICCEAGGELDIFM